MKKLKLIKVIASSLVVASVLVLNPIGASANWKQNSNGWWNTEGSSWSIGWKEIDEKWYYFGQDGYMVHDTTIDGYKLGSDGAWIEIALNTPPQTWGDYKSGSDSFNTGWKLINGKYYYFDFDGARVHDKTVDSYYLGADGAWVTTQGKSNLQDFTMKTEKSSYELGTDNIKVYITNNTNLESVYGTRYEVDKFQSNEWYYLDFAKDADFTDIAAIQNPQSTGPDNCKLSKLQDFKNLTPGKYRIVKEIVNSTGYSHVIAEFELK